MLRHVRQSEIYWFCRECWQEIPVYNLNTARSLSARNLVPELPIKKQYSALAIA